METIPARWYHDGRRGSVRLIVVHSTESSERPEGAEAVARYFATTDRKASTHRVSDNNSTVRCVDDADTAFGAAGANHDGLHLELCGKAGQSAQEWTDAYSRAELEQAGSTVREWSARWDVPLRWLTITQVADGHSRGLCTHADVSKAFPDVSTGHWDPGPSFPKALALEIWTKETDMTPEQEATLVRIDERLTRLERRVGTDNEGRDLSDESDAQIRALRAIMENLGLDPADVKL